jgi:hypothetical protein
MPIIIQLEWHARGVYLYVIVMYDISLMLGMRLN